MLHSGIDLHPRSMTIATVATDGQPVQDARLPTTHAALRGYFASLPGPHRAVVESTADWYWVRDLLASAGIDLHLGHAKGTPLSRRKTRKWPRLASPRIRTGTGPPGPASPQF